MTRAIVNLLQGDYDTLINIDSKHLGFLPHDMDTTELKPVLKTILKEGLVEAGSNLHDRRRNLMAISNELNEVFFQYPFRYVLLDILCLMISSFLLLMMTFTNASM